MSSERQSRPAALQPGQLELFSQNPEQTLVLGRLIGPVLTAGSVLLLSGDLGAGKTQFAKGIGQGVGVTEPLISPTFNLVLEYPIIFAGKSSVIPANHTDSNFPNTNSRNMASSFPTLLRHFDLYRLEDSEQLADIDYFGLLEDERALSLVEWGDRFADALPLDFLLLRMSQLPDQTDARVLSFAAHGSQAQRLLSRIAAVLADADDNANEVGKESGIALVRPAPLADADLSGSSPLQNSMNTYLAKGP